MKLISFFFIGILFALDQGSKFFASKTLVFFEPKMIVKPFLAFELVHNYGAAYGIFQNQRLFLLAVSVFVIVGGIYFASSLIESQWSEWGMIFLLSGALGNFSDRLVFGYVIDFIDIGLFPVFNVADMLINAAVICFVVEMFRGKKVVSG